MTYDETLHYLYESVPVFQHSGASAYKPGLGTSQALDNYLGNPHTCYKTIHIAGTNGKGSVSHLLAATLQEAGYKTGLYTSPHLTDFRERIRINGEMISKKYVVEFVEKYKEVFEPLHPSFFELTSTMAFAYFRDQKVDFAIIETGLGGRLDSTNIISPRLSIITNISPDHKQFLGETLPEIAREKAGIIKNNIPVVIGEADEKDVKKIFAETAHEKNAPIWFAGQTDVVKNLYSLENGEWCIDSTDFGVLTGELKGNVQSKNYCTVLTALHVLNKMNLFIPAEAVRKAFNQVVEITGLRGRWETLQEKPRVICDTGHNEGAWSYLRTHLESESKQYERLYMIIGMANDKDIKNILSLMPGNAFYYFTKASIPRAMPAEELAEAGRNAGLSSVTTQSVEEAVKKVLEQAGENDLVFIGGSTFVVADALPLFG